MKRILKEKAITLIALVITIVVLIILAGVAINLGLGENGLFKKAESATSEYDKQSATEKINLKITTYQISTYAKSKRMPTLKELAIEFEKDNEIQYVNGIQRVASTQDINFDIATSIFTKLKAYPYEFEINSSLQLASINGIKIAENIGGSNNFSIYIDDNNVNAFPKKSDGYYPGIVECTDGASALWSYKNWQATISNLESINTKFRFKFYSKDKFITHINDGLANNKAETIKVLDGFETAKVPTMSSAQQNGYKITGSSTWSNNASSWSPYTAFDSNTTDSYTFYPIVSPGWVCVEFPFEVMIYKFNFIGYGSDVAKTYKIYSSTDGNSWTSRTGNQYKDAPANDSMIYLDSTTSAKFWKFETTTIRKYYNIQFYGVKL